MLSVAEEDGTVSVCAALAITPATATTSRAIMVTLATSDGTATSASDYVLASMNLMFPSGSGDGAMQCLGVSIIDDSNAMEGEETFIVTLTTSDTVILGNSTTTITITDNNGKSSVVIDSCGGLIAMRGGWTSSQYHVTWLKVQEYKCRLECNQLAF